jgi:UDPglucose--hexose-1-phosphate uridylyltransferase
MNELRKNILNGNWVIISPGRAERKSDFIEPDKSDVSQPAIESDCPFCRGNESMLDEILYEQPAGDDKIWRVRVVVNKYPVVEDVGSLKKDEDKSTAGKGSAPEPEQEVLFSKKPAKGMHEVLIEHPVHNLDLADMSLGEVGYVVQAYRDRCEAMYEISGIKSVVVFRNHGPDAGTSLRHPHSQITALDIEPDYIARQKSGLQNYYNSYNRCLICDLVENELQAGERVFFDNENFAAFVPFWAGVPYETYIVPKKHNINMSELDQNGVEDFAYSLLVVLKAVKSHLKDADYNYVLHNYCGNDETGEHLHWYLQLLPITTHIAGFEKGSGIRINPSMPSRDAEKLKERVEEILKEDIS